MIARTNDLEAGARNTTAGGGETQAEVDVGSGSIAATLGLNVSSFFSQLFNFAVVLAIVWFLILKPLTKKLEERRKLIDDSLDKAKEIETKMVMANQAYQEKLDDAKTQANRIAAKAHEEAKVMGDKMKLEAKTEIATLVGQAREKIQTEKEATILEIRSETVKLATLMAEKILGSKLQGAEHESYVSDRLPKMKK